MAKAKKSKPKAAVPALKLAQKPASKMKQNVAPTIAMHAPKAIGEAIVQMKGIEKNFPGVRALRGVSFDLRAGEVHALMGENGAGKPTLMKILTGVYQEDGGEIRVEGIYCRLCGSIAIQISTWSVICGVHSVPFLFESGLHRRITGF